MIGKMITLLLIGGMVIMPADVNAATNESAEALAIRMIAKYEGFRSYVYTCPGGKSTIGYGFTRKELVDKGTITRQEADKELGKEVRKRLVVIRKHCKGLTPKQEAAVCSFMYNVGETAFLKSTFLKKLKINDFVGAREEIKKWNKSGGKVLAGLTKRRNAEAAWI